MRRTARQTGPERRQTILAAAAEVFAARGYPAASMREIAAAAGITKPVLYDHFRAKDELYIRLIEGARDELIAGSAAAMQLDAATADRVRTAIERFFEHVERRPAMARLLFTVPEGDSQVVRAALRVQAEATTSLAALLGSEPDLLPDIPDRERRLELGMEFIKKGLHGLALWWLDHPETPRTLVAEAATTVAWGGLQSLSRDPVQQRRLPSGEGS